MARIVEWREREAMWADVPDGGTLKSVGCDGTQAIVYAGHGVTDMNGQWRVSLPGITCYNPKPRSRPSIVAMPTWDEEPTARLVPIIMGAQVGGGGNVLIYSQDPSGNPVDNVPFSWHCVMEFDLVEDR